MTDPQQVTMEDLRTVRGAVADARLSAARICSALERALADLAEDGESDE